MKDRPVTAKFSMRLNGRIDRCDKGNISFHNFMTAHINWYALLAVGLRIELLLTLSTEQWKFIM